MQQEGSGQTITQSKEANFIVNRFLFIDALVGNVSGLSGVGLFKIMVLRFTQRTRATTPEHRRSYHSAADHSQKGFNLGRVKLLFQLRVH